MLEIKYINISLNDTNYFTFERGSSKYTKTYCRDNKGKYPVYSANNNIPLGYLDKYDYDGEYLTFSVNGIAGIISTVSGKFSINADRFVLIVNDKSIDKEYIKYAIQSIFRKNIKGRIGHDGENEFTKLPYTIIKKLSVNIPVNENGEFDVEVQKELAKKYKKIEEDRDELKNKRNVLRDKEFEIEYDDFENVIFGKIAKLKSIQIGLGQKGLNKYKSIDGVEVYSAASSCICKIDYKSDNLIKASDDNPVLTIATNGDGCSGRNIIVHTNDFYIDSGRCIVDFNKDIDIKFMNYLLRNVKYLYGFNRSKQFNTYNTKDIYFKIPIENGKWSLERQREISDKYDKLINIKNNVINKINQLLDTKPEY